MIESAEYPAVEPSQKRPVEENKIHNLSLRGILFKSLEYSLTRTIKGLG